MILTGCSSHALRKEDVLRRNSQVVSSHEGPGNSINPHSPSGIVSSESFGDFSDIIVIDKFSDEELKRSPINLIIGEKRGLSSLYCIIQYVGQKEIQYDQVLLVNDTGLILCLDLDVFDGEVSRRRGLIHETHKISLSGYLEEEVIDFINKSGEINMRFYGKRVVKDFSVKPESVNGLKEILAAYSRHKEAETDITLLQL